MVKVDNLYWSCQNFESYDRGAFQVELLDRILVNNPCRSCLDRCDIIVELSEWEWFYW